MTKNTASLVVLLGYLAIAHPAAAQCTKDTDCKGDRICVAGECVGLMPEPTAALPDQERPPAARLTFAVATNTPPRSPTSPQATSASTPSGAVSQASAEITHQQHPPDDPKPWFAGYAESGGLISFRSWGGEMYSKRDVSIDRSATGMTGSRLAGYYVTSERFHLGGFLSYLAGEETWEGPGSKGTVDGSDLSLGLALKLGHRLSEHLWLGFGLDAGVLFHEEDEEFATTGLQLFPRFNCDIMALSVGSFRLGFTTALGAQIQPYATGTYETVDVQQWTVRLSFLLGMTIGGA